MATLQQIREKAARMLGQYGEGQVLRSNISDDLDQAYLEVFAILQAQDLAAWSLADNIPDRFAQPVAILVAEARATEYHIPTDRYQRIKGEAIGAMHTIRELQAPTKVGVTEIENY